jgi:quinol monooxygenase YgiN
MKRLSGIFAISMVVLLFSCSNEPAKEETKSGDTTAAATVPPAEVKPVFTPFKVAMIQHRVKNFEKWEEGYFSHDSVRKAYGISHWMIGRDLKDSNLVYIVDKMEDLAKAKTFSTLPNLKEAMKKAGVISVPGFSYAEVIRSDDSPTESTDRLGVAHHVKDFAAWLKVFDAEGPATRAANGLIDRSLARSLVDSNMVYIIFAVSDIAKAKARVTSPELKKIMTDAGVDSPPTTRWYRVVK